MREQKKISCPELIYEDSQIIVFNKPPGISLLADGTGAPCLWNWLTSEYCRKYGGGRPYLVHRLDKGVSGFWLVARTQEAQSKLTQQFNKREVDKI
ncbi:MAG: pseudouridine synthase, partial [Candidatus Sumerlaeia bacterium]|nr:pseudouridine synthase [Candidatus Sumerlaeia bacterium]